jgi:hypothetical protein
MFFPKGSPWDGFVVIRDVFAEATATITVIDAYCDGTVFKMLAQRPLDKLHIRILCSKGADAVSAEAKAFTAQHPGATAEVRKTKDCHDRFILLDGKTCIHIGASIRDAGKTAWWRVAVRAYPCGRRARQLRPPGARAAVVIAPPRGEGACPSERGQSPQ